MSEEFEVLYGEPLVLTHNYPFRFGLISDLHVGAQHGIHPFGYRDRVTGEGFTWDRLNGGQKILWKYMKAYCREMKENQVNVLIILGDIIGGQNWKEKGGYMMYTDMNVQIRACAELISQICKLVPSIQKVFLFRGTPYHGARDLSAEEQVVGELNTYYDIKAQYRGEYGYLTLKYGKRKKILWLAHPATGATMYPETALGRDIGEFLKSYGMGKLPKVDMIIRAHRHEYMDLHKSTIRYIILPCWQFYVPFDKAVKWYARWQPDIGGAILLADEKVRLRPWHFTYPNVVNPKRFIKLRHQSDKSRIKQVNKNISEKAK